MSKIVRTYVDVLEDNVTTCLNNNEEGMKILQSIVQNILNFPLEKKYRKLSKTNQKLSKILTKEFKQILLFLDFGETEEHYIFNSEDMVKLRKTYQMITLFTRLHQNFSQSETNNLIQDMLSTVTKLEINHNWTDAISECQQIIAICNKYRERYPYLIIITLHAYVSMAVLYEKERDYVATADAYREAVTLYPEIDVKLALQRGNNVELRNLLQAYSGVCMASLHIVDSRGNYKEIYNWLITAYELAITVDDDKAILAIIQLGISMGINTKNKKIEQYWTKLRKERIPDYTPNDFSSRFIDIESKICNENAQESIDKILEIIDEALQVGQNNFAGCLYGQIIFHHRKFPSLKLEDGIAYGQKGLDLILPLHGEKDRVVRNIYLSMADIYKRTGQYDLEKVYSQKRDYSNQLLGEEC